MFLDNLIVNIAANIITAALIGVSVYVAFYTHMSGVIHTFRRFANPNKRVFVIHDIKISRVNKLSKSQFILPIQEYERDIIAKFHASRNNSVLFNGVAVRLDSIDLDTNSTGGAIVNVSVVSFFDFIATNLVAYPANVPQVSFYRQTLIALQALRIMSSIQQVITAVEKYGHPTKVEDVLRNRSLANIVAVSILVFDSSGRAGIVKRSHSVAVSSGKFGATCTGTVNNIDMGYPDPFLACAIREIKEEIGIDISAEQFCFDGILVPKQKMQPVFLYYCEIEQRWEDLLSSIKTGEDMQLENIALYAVPKNSLAEIVPRLNFADTAAYQVWRYAKQNSLNKSWHKAVPQSVLPMNLEKYLLWPK
jgi:8-oxo-dGTP pyrophosphatase MutT (NUDIX family)